MKAIALLFLLLAGRWSIAQEPVGIVTGTVILNGDPPRAKRLMIPCSNCGPLYPEGMEREELRVGKDGAVAGAFVYVKTGLEGRKFALPESPVLLSMKACRFESHVLGLRAGQNLRIHNLDPHNHCVHAIPLENREFNVAVLPGGEFEKSFDKPEVMIRLKNMCSPWMSAWIGVVDHPFFAVTGADGKFELKGLPPGKYTIEVWQEKCVAAAQQIGIGEKESKAVPFALELKKE